MAELEDGDNATPEYAQGFNEGYLLAERFPELAEKIAVAMGEDERGLGFKAGRTERIEEWARDHRPGWLRNDPYQRSLSIDSALDKDGPEPDFEP